MSTLTFLILAGTAAAQVAARVVVMRKGYLLPCQENMPD
jgi:hypothetical protein